MKRTFLSVGLTLSQVQTMSSNFLFQSVYLSFPFPSSYAPSIWNFDVSTLGPMPFRSVKFSHSVVSDSLQPHGLQHARPPCPSPTPGVHSNSCLSSRWSPSLFNLYAEYIMWNARLDGAQAGIKFARRNINNLTHMQMTPPLWQKAKKN